MTAVQTPTSVLPFLGPDLASTYDAARVVILPIPYEATTTYRNGCENGPDAILEASGQVEYYDEELDWKTGKDIGIYTDESIADTRNGRSVSSEEMLQVTRETVSQMIADGKFVIGLGGEHSAREIATQPDWMERAVASIPTRRVFLTIDLDGIDPTLIPGVGTPEPGGLNWYSLLSFLRQVFQNHEVIGCNVMELAPIVDSVVSDFTAAKLVYKLIGYQAFSQGE